MEFSEVVASLAIVVVAGAAGQRYVTKRLPGDRDVFLAFAPFAIVGLMTFLPNPESYYDNPAVLVLLYAQPVLFARLVRHVGKSWAVPGVVAAIGGIMSIAIALQDPSAFTQDTAAADVSVGLIVASIAAFLIPNLWVGIQFTKAAHASAGVTKVRLTWAAFASFVFIASLMTYSLPPDSPLAIISDFVSLVLATSFLLGFAPPRWIQRAWRSTAYMQFVKATEGIPADATDDEVDRRLLDSTKGVLDATAIRFGERASTDPKDISVATGASGHRAYLIASFHGPRLFPADDRTTLSALSGQMHQFLEPRERIRREAQARHAAEEQAAFKASFLRHFGHEVANPVSPIRLQAKMLSEGATPEQQRRLDVIQRSVTRIDEIIQDVSAVAKAIDPRAPREIKDLDIGQVLRDAAVTYMDMAAKGKCTIEVEANGDLGIKADPSRLMQAFDNLYSNAIKYSPAGGAIRVTGAAVDGGVRIDFRDAGLGFTEEQRLKLFGTYSRVHREIAPTIPGSGLGLYLVQEVAHAHGGWAKAASDGPGKGSTFSIWLPVAPAQAPGVGGFRA